MLIKTQCCTKYQTPTRVKENGKHILTQMLKVLVILLVVKISKPLIFADSKTALIF